MIPVTRLSRHQQNSLFRSFLAVFVGYNPRFVVPGGFRFTVTPHCTTIEASAKCVISTIFGRFRGLERISMPCDPRYTTIEASAKCVISTIFCRFYGLPPTTCGLERISMTCDPCYTTIEASAKLVISAIFCRFRGL